MDERVGGDRSQRDAGRRPTQLTGRQRWTKAWAKLIALGEQRPDG